MSQTVSLILSAQMRQSLQTIVDDRRQAVKHVLLSDERLTVLEGKRRPGPTFWSLTG